MILCHTTNVYPDSFMIQLSLFNISKLMEIFHSTEIYLDKINYAGNSIYASENSHSKLMLDGVHLYVTGNNLILEESMNIKKPKDKSIQHRV